MIRIGLLLGLIICSVNISAQKFFKSTNGKYHLNLRTDHVLTPAEMSDLKEAGIDRIQFANQGVYAVTISSPIGYVLDQVSRLGYSLDIPREEDKIQVSLAQYLAHHPQIQDIDLIIEWNEKIDPKDFFLEKNLSEEIRITKSKFLSSHLTAVHLPVSLLSNMAVWPEVKSMDLHHPKDTVLNVFSRRMAGVAYGTNSPTNGGLGLLGEGITVGVGDNTNVYNHVDYSDRHINHNPYPQNNHGYHVCGTVAGAGIIRERFRGVLTKSTLVSSLFSNILSYSDDYYRDYDMTLTNNSYGAVAGDCNLYGLYDLTSQGLDQLIVENTKISHIFAAGNSGQDSCDSHPKGLFKIYGQYQSAKNTITVANMVRSEEITIYSSQGPLKFDRRLKPDIAAVGQLVLSTYPNDTYGYGWGSSMACPEVVGVAGMVQQEFRDLYGEIPESDIVKAFLLNGAFDLGNKGPDVAYGYGRLDAYRTLKMVEQNNYFVDSVALADSVKLDLNITSNTELAKIMLVYHDLPGASRIDKALINDLDLYVKHPNGNITRPYIINITDDSTVILPAIRGIDTLNNVEQVVLEKPDPGNYQIIIKGTHIVNNAQRFVVSYDTIPQHIHIRSPFTSETLVSGATERIYWNTYDADSSTVDLEYSLDDGLTWNTIITGIPAVPGHYPWSAVLTDSVGGKIRVVSSNGVVGESGIFTANPLLKVTISGAAFQCPGSRRITWNGNSSFTDYLVYKRIGAEMALIDSTTDLSYIYRNLSTTENEYLTIRPRKGDKLGARAYAKFEIANDGDCVLPEYDGDLALLSVSSSLVGRQFTGSALGTNETITLNFQCLDDQVMDSIALHYRIDNGAWNVTNIYNVPANTPSDFDINNVDLSSTGTHLFEAYIENLTLTDDITSNDSLRVEIRNLSNDPDDLSTDYTQSFETADTLSSSGHVGIGGIEEFDVIANHPVGRARSYFISSLAHTGDKYMTLDIDHVINSSITTNLVLTKNFSPLDVNSDDVRFDFYYAHHGQDTIYGKDNHVYVRGDENSPWLNMYDLFANQKLSTADYRFVQSIEISKYLRDNGQNFSSSSQIRFAQTGVFPAGDRDILNGYTFDDIKLYTVNKDVFIQSIEEPTQVGCSLASNAALKLNVRNSHLDTLQNVSIGYRLDNGAWNTILLPILYADSTHLIDIGNVLDLSSLGMHDLDFYVFYPEDSYRENDTIFDYQVLNQPLIDAFPYIEDFESDDGYFYSYGRNNSWTWETPSGHVIDRAASGDKAWRTGSEHYNANEIGYLESPCLDIMGLDDPYLSFNMIYSIERCDPNPCDGAWLEYSSETSDWTKMDLDTSIFDSWYDDVDEGLWTGTHSYWKSYSIKLPKEPGLKVRWVMSADPGLEMEGLSIDDIHVYDLEESILLDSASTEYTSTSTLMKDTWNLLSEGSEIYAGIYPRSEDLENTKVTLYTNHNVIRTIDNEYYLDRNLVVMPPDPNLSDTVWIRMYVPQSDIDRAVFDTSCTVCVRPRDFVDIGITEFASIYDSLENDLLYDNTIGSVTNFAHQDIKKVPYLDGYYFEFPVSHFSEFWLTYGSGDSTEIPQPNFESIDAWNQNNEYATVEWIVSDDYNTHHFEVQRADGNQGFQDQEWQYVGEVLSAGNAAMNTYTYDDINIPNFNEVYYYRVKSVSNDGTYILSEGVPVVFGTGLPWEFYPNPFRGSSKFYFQLEEGTILQVEITDMIGRMVESMTAKATGYEDFIEIGSGLSAGIYYLRISSEDREETIRINKY